MMRLLFLSGLLFSLPALAVPLPFRSCPSPTQFATSAPALLVALDPFPLLAGASSSCAAAGGTASPCAPHHVYVPNATVTPREPLVVFLPGTNMEPDKHDLVLQAAAYAGYRTIGLSYDNQRAINVACAVAPNCGSNCTGNARQEAILGRNLSAQVAIPRGDSVLERLYRALVELDTLFPGDGWNAYYVPTAGNIAASNIVWSNIIIAGFSQGAGHAAIISRLQQVHGLVILDGAGDTCYDPVLGMDVAAEWATTGIDQSAGRPKYALGHAHGMVPYVVPVTWQALGLGTTASTLDGTLSDVIDTVPPRRISWTEQGFPALPPICSEHMSMARDQCLPTDVSGVTAAASAPDSRLFGPMLRRFCYACDAGVCS